MTFANIYISALQRHLSRRTNTRIILEWQRNIQIKLQHIIHKLENIYAVDQDTAFLH